MKYLASNLVLLLGCQAANPTTDEITSQPGISWDINYSQYSGFLELDNGHNLHYWFVESQNDPTSDPVTLWLNGGPGCSSLDGLVYENGPFHVNHSGGLYKNSYAWNLYSNVLYLESPIGVGYSYNADSDRYVMNDNTTADDNYNALLKFFEAFTDFSGRDFYVTGESYGGVYVPTLVLRILQGNDNNEGEKINLKGFAVGNGVTNDAYLDDSDIWFAYYHGLIDDLLWTSLQENCCDAPYTRTSCHFSDTVEAPDTVACLEDSSQVSEVIYGGQLNWYNIYGTCFTTTEEVVANKQEDAYKKYFREMDFRRYKKYTKTFESHYENLNEAVPCIDSTGADIYLNREDVKEAIHVNNVTRKWSICSSILDYTSLYSDLAPVYEEIFNLDSDIYAVVYNGDTDMACNFLGDEWFVEDLNYTALNEYREWFVDATESYNSKQVAGWTIDYDRLSFVTVRGSGHMVPQYKPEAALKMFEYFLEHKQL